MRGVDQVDQRYGLALLENLYPRYGGPSTGVPFFMDKGRFISDNGKLPTNEKEWIIGCEHYLAANEYIPHVGDYIWFYYYNRTVGTDHVAIVEGVPPSDAHDWDHGANQADLMRALGRVCAPLQELLEAAPGASLNAATWRLWALADRPPLRGADQMARGLVALAGDAAHPMRPFLAQGAGMAIEDAAELGRAMAMDAVDVPTRLKRYALARWQRCARVQARSVRNGQIFHSTGLMRLGRDALMRVMGARLMDVPWLYGR